MTKPGPIETRTRAFAETNPPGELIERARADIQAQRDDCDAALAIVDSIQPREQGSLPLSAVPKH